MSQAEILTILRSHTDELKQAGLAHLHLFGSLARNDHGPDSDVDLLADFAPNQKLTLVTIGSLQQRLTRLLSRDVDLSSAEWMHERVRVKALAEAVLVF